MMLSGGQWVSHFPNSANMDDLAEPFRTNARRFVGALRQAQATVAIAATLRPPERAYLMHFAFLIARAGIDPSTVPPRAGVDIQWVHRTAQGVPDLAASRAAAEQMVQGYGVVVEPVLDSQHIRGKAIDMTIRWQNNLVIAKADGTSTTITSVPRTGEGNVDLRQVGASFGVIKLVSDPPHWSLNGH